MILFFSLLLPTGLLSLNSLFPSIYDIDGCANTAVSLVSGWVYFVTTGWTFFRSAYVRIQSINQPIGPVASNGSRLGDIAHAHCTSNGCGKGEAHINWSMGLPEKATPTRATMGPMALCRRTLGGDAIGTQFLRETLPMALFRCRYHTVAESGRKARGP